ncbi:MAG: hypothetical protein VKK97_04120 [Synechococcaceae cyanobacterium]|nr:hypothetical protein [Synechococcaceae cyanobacterium]
MRRISAEPRQAQQGASAATTAAPAALDSLSRLQQLVDASPQVAQLRRLQALADARYSPVSQLASGPEEEERVQGQFASAELQPQLQQAPRANNSGLPNNLKSGIEALSGLSMDPVRVNYNSAQPAKLNALAYAQGSDIHLAPGQERHLPVVLQARFDPQDINRMRAVARDDIALSEILEEVIAIHDRMPEDLNYGESFKGGEAGLNEQGKGHVVVKDERWAITRRIKDYFNAYGMEHDIKRQSMIIHELTHLAELYTNLPSHGGVVPEDKRPKNEKELAKAMEPEEALVNEVYQQKGAVEKLLDDSDYDGSMKTYLRGRLEYGFAINAENPTVFTEIGYYLAAHGKRGTAFYDKIMVFAKNFFSSRKQRLAKRE